MPNHIYRRALDLDEDHVIIETMYQDPDATYSVRSSSAGGFDDDKRMPDNHSIKIVGSSVPVYAGQTDFIYVEASIPIERGTDGSVHIPGSSSFFGTVHPLIQLYVYEDDSFASYETWSRSADPIEETGPWEGRIIVETAPVDAKRSVTRLILDRVLLEESTTKERRYFSFTLESLIFNDTTQSMLGQTIDLEDKYLDDFTVVGSTEGGVLSGWDSKDGTSLSIGSFFGSPTWDYGAVLNGTDQYMTLGTTATLQNMTETGVFALAMKFRLADKTDKTILKTNGAAGRGVFIGVRDLGLDGIRLVCETTDSTGSVLISHKAYLDFIAVDTDVTLAWVGDGVDSVMYLTHTDSGRNQDLVSTEAVATEAGVHAFQIFLGRDDNASTGFFEGSINSIVYGTGGVDDISLPRLPFYQAGAIPYADFIPDLFNLSGSRGAAYDSTGIQWNSFTSSQAHYASQSLNWWGVHPIQGEVWELGEDYSTASISLILYSYKDAELDPQVLKTYYASSGSVTVDEYGGEGSYLSVTIRDSLLLESTIHSGTYVVTTTPNGNTSYMQELTARTWIPVLTPTIICNPSNVDPVITSTTCTWETSGDSNYDYVNYTGTADDGTVIRMQWNFNTELHEHYGEVLNARERYNVGNTGVYAYIDYQYQWFRVTIESDGKTYLAIRGGGAMTEAGSAGGTMTQQLDGLEFIEVIIDEDGRSTEVPNGDTWCITTITLTSPVTAP